MSGVGRRVLGVSPEGLSSAGQRSGELAASGGGFQTLRVWQHAREIVRAVYALTDAFPAHELYAMTSQLRRASTSVAANIAEGHARRTAPDKVRFVVIAQGSLNEIVAFIQIARDVGYAPENAEFDALLERASKALMAYYTAIARSAVPRSPERCPAEERPSGPTPSTHRPTQ